MRFKVLHFTLIEEPMLELASENARKAASILNHLFALEAYGCEDDAAFAVINDRYDVLDIEIGWRPKSVVVIVHDSATGETHNAILYRTSRRMYGNSSETVARMAAGLLDIEVRSIHILRDWRKKR